MMPVMKDLDPAGFFDTSTTPVTGYETGHRDHVKKYGVGDTRS